MSRIAGRLALKEAIKQYRGTQPVKVTIIGTGPAGLSAALEAKKQGAAVQIFGRKEHHRAELESAGLIYYVLPEEQSPTKFIQSHLSQETIVVTAARSVREKSPILIDEASLDTLPENAVIVDLAAGEGGNVVGSKSDEVVRTKKGISIVNVSGYPKAEPNEASQEYGKCILNLLGDILLPNGELLIDHELCIQCCVTHKGQRILA